MQNPETCQALKFGYENYLDNDKKKGSSTYFSSSLYMKHFQFITISLLLCFSFTFDDQENWR